jgi:hypothetical protein
MRWHLLLAFLASLAFLGCGKKSPPESSGGSGVSTDLVQIVVLRRDAAGMTEQASFRGILLVTNTYDHEIVLERVEYSGRVGSKEVPGAIEQLEIALPAGQTTELRLNTVLGWKDNAPINAEQGSVGGTLFYRGPKGNIRALPFSFTGELSVRGE